MPVYLEFHVTSATLPAVQLTSYSGGLSVQEGTASGGAGAGKVILLPVSVTFGFVDFLPEIIGFTAKGLLLPAVQIGFLQTAKSRPTAIVTLNRALITSLIATSTGATPGAELVFEAETITTDTYSTDGKLLYSVTV